MPGYRFLIFRFQQTVTCVGVKIQFVDPLEVLDASTGLIAKRMPAVKSMQHDTFQQIPERHVVILSESLEDLQQTFFETYARLNSLNQYVFILRDCFGRSFLWHTSPAPPEVNQQQHGTYVPR